MPDLPAYANLDPVLCFAPGLFRSIERGTRSQPLKSTWTKDGDAQGRYPGQTFEFRSDVLLGADDLRVLQGVLAFANRDAAKITPEMGGDLARLRSGLRLGDEARDGDALLVTLGYAELARAVGYGRRNGRDLHGGGLTKKIRGSLNRLAGLGVVWQWGDFVARWHLLSWDDRGARGSKLRVALNPRLGACACGKPPFARVDLEVARRLNTDPARLMHQRLSAWLGRAKEARKINIDTLAGYPWSSAATGTDCARKRRFTTRSVIDELRAAGWVIKDVEGRSTSLLVSGSNAAPPPASKAPESSEAPMEGSRNNEAEQSPKTAPTD